MTNGTGDPHKDKPKKTVKEEKKDISPHPQNLNKKGK